MYLWGSLKQVLCPDKQVLTGTVPAIPPAIPQSNIEPNMTLESMFRTLGKSKNVVETL